MGHLATCHRQEHQGPTHVGTKAFERTLCYVPLPSPEDKSRREGLWSRAWALHSGTRVWIPFYH